MKRWYRTERGARKIAVLPGILISIFAWKIYQSLKNVEVKELMKIIFATKSSHMITRMKMKLVRKVSESSMPPTSEVSDTAVPCIHLHLEVSHTTPRQSGGWFLCPPLCLTLYRSDCKFQQVFNGRQDSF
jgi:hypothetical protein